MREQHACYTVTCYKRRNVKDDLDYGRNKQNTESC